MAKRRTSETDTNLLSTTAENIGTALGHLAARLEGWKRQRAEIAKDLQKTIQSAQGMLTDLGHRAEAAGRRGARQANRIRKGGRPKGYIMSDETKAKLRAAWRRRKAAAERGVESALAQMPTSTHPAGTKRSRKARSPKRQG